MALRNPQPDSLFALTLGGVAPPSCAVSPYKPTHSASPSASNPLPETAGAAELRHHHRLSSQSTRPVDKPEHQAIALPMSAPSSILVNTGSPVAADRYQLPSLHHVLDILEFLHSEGEGVTLAVLASHVGLTKPGAHRILRNLISRGYVLQEAQRGCYCLGIRLWQLGTLPSAIEAYRNTVTPFLHRLSAEVGETSHLVIMEGREIVYLSRVETPQAVQAYGRVGDRAPAHCVATGKAILAKLSDTNLEVFLKAPLQSYTPRTITRIADFTNALDGIRSNGFATNDGEWRDGVTGVGVALQPSRQWFPAIGISGPTYRFSVEQAVLLAPALSRIASDIQNVIEGTAAVA